MLHAVTLEYKFYPDLISTSVTVPPSIATIGSAVSISATVQNLGPSVAGSSNAAFYLVGNGTSYPLGSTAVPALGPGQSYPINVPVTIPSMSIDSYYIQVCADSTSAVTETDEANNFTAGNIFRGQVTAIVPCLKKLMADFHLKVYRRSASDIH